jgi:hypothetical protein
MEIEGTKLGIDIAKHKIQSIQQAQQVRQAQQVERKPE